MNLLRRLMGLVLGKRLPVVAGEITTDGVRSTVTVRRDAHGVPYIDARTDEDAFFALGFCQAQDRRFQIEMYQRTARGTLAELVGPVLLPADQLARRVGFSSIGAAQFQGQGPEVRRLFESFAAGVNAGTRQGLRRLPHEFALLRFEPTPFEPSDILAIMQFQTFALATNWDTELARLMILRHDGEEALRALDVSFPDWLPVPGGLAGSADAAARRLSEDLAVVRGVVGASAASNTWVLAPSRTATGRPILASDPHLAPRLPAPWCLAHVRTPEWAMTGAFFPSQPNTITGHNEHVAWGSTAGHVDNTDLFLEQVGPDGRSVRQGDSFVPCPVRREVIRVKGQADVVEDVLVTPRGPVVSPALGSDVALSIRGTWILARRFDAFHRLPRVRTIDEFHRCFESFPGLSLGRVFADRTGRIGFHVIGDAPRRKKGHGLIPMPGWDADGGWHDDPVPFAEMPHLTDPESGVLATANQQPLPEGRGPYLGSDWLDGYRYARIIEATTARRDWDVAGTAKLQLDQLSIPWREVREAVLAAVDGDSEGGRLLTAWDGRVTGDSVAAAVFELFVADMVGRVCKAKAPRAADWAMGRGVNVLLKHGNLILRRLSHLMRLVREQPEGWFANGWATEMRASLTGVMEALHRQHGASAEKWRWGRVRPLTLRHALGERKPFDRVYNLGPVGFGGDSATIAQAPSSFAEPTENPAGIPNLRVVIDVGEWENSRWAVAGGQSGNPLSPHYDDLFAGWREGDGIQLAWRATTVERVARSTLVLRPRSANAGDIVTGSRIPGGA